MKLTDLWGNCGTSVDDDQLAWCLRSARELPERDQPALRRRVSGLSNAASSRLRFLVALPFVVIEYPLDPALIPTGRNVVYGSWRPLASVAKRSLRLGSKLIRSDYKNRVRNGIRNIYDSQVTTRIRLAERDSRSTLSRPVFHWMIQDGLDLVFCHVVTVDVRCPLPGSL